MNHEGLGTLEVKNTYNKMHSRFPVVRDICWPLPQKMVHGLRDHKLRLCSVLVPLCAYHLIKMTCPHTSPATNTGGS